MSDRLATVFFSLLIPFAHEFFTTLIYFSLLASLNIFYFQPDTWELIQAAFFQSKVTLAAGTDGSGLGLSICKHYVEQMNGELELSSVEGEGSTFSVVLPQD